MIQWYSIVTFMILGILNFSVHSAIAKCPIKIYEIRGIVSDSNNIPINDAHVSIFFDGEEVGFTGLTGLSSKNGEFKIRCIYSTFRMSSIFGDICKGIPSSLTIIIYAKAYFTKRIIAKMDQTHKENEIDVLEISPVILVQIPPLALELLKQGSGQP